MERCRMVFTGSGGQGVITVAIVLAESAVLYENLLATQTQSYGPEARGGATRSDVIVADTCIRYPKVDQTNVLVCLTQEAYTKYHDIVRPGSILLTDPHFVQPMAKVDARQVALPMFASIMEKIGKPIVFSICMLGVVIGLTGVVKPESVKKTLADRIPKEFLNINHQALEIGLRLVGER